MKIIRMAFNTPNRFSSTVVTKIMKRVEVSNVKAPA